MSVAIVLLVFGALDLWLHSSMRLRPSTQLTLTVADLGMVALGLVLLISSLRVGRM